MIEDVVCMGGNPHTEAGDDPQIDTRIQPG